jgi:hypothetical protein
LSAVPFTGVPKVAVLLVAITTLCPAVFNAHPRLICDILIGVAVKDVGGATVGVAEAVIPVV